MRDYIFRVWDKTLGKMITQDATDRIDKCVTYWELHIKVILMQYIGMKDKHGKKIFEGDIVFSKDWNPTHFEVIFCEGSFGFTRDSLDGYTNDPQYLDKFEVVGNKYENPELLE